MDFNRITYYNKIINYDNAGSWLLPCLSLKHGGISTYVGDRARAMALFNLIGGDQWGSVEIQDSK